MGFPQIVGCPREIYAVVGLRQLWVISRVDLVPSLVEMRLSSRGGNGGGHGGVVLDVRW